jgi:adenylate cyclase
MAFVQGELVPVGGGDPIPLLREVMSVGRRESCDICLRFPNISGTHCEFYFKDGYWFIRDLGSTNGVKINGQRMMKRALRPGDEVTIANHRFTIQYDLPSTAEEGLEKMLAEVEDTSQSLLEKAGLVKKSSQSRLLSDDNE